MADDKNVERGSPVLFETYSGSPHTLFRDFSMGDFAIIGGMMTADGSRRRTAGGVYFYLLRTEMPPPAYRKLMAQDKKRKTELREARHKKRGRPDDDARPQAKRPSIDMLLAGGLTTPR